jgi:hypothetical protein
MRFRPQHGERASVPPRDDGIDPVGAECFEEAHVGCVDNVAPASLLDDRCHPMMQTTTPAPASGGGSPSFCSSAASRTGVGHVFPGGLDPAVGALDVGDAERVDVAVEGIGEAGHPRSDAKGS